MPGKAGRRGSIATSFILIVLVILVLGQGALWGWFLFTQKENARSTLLDKVKMAARSLSDVSTHAITSNDLALLRRYAENIVADEDILTVKVTNRQGGILVHISEGAVGSAGRFNPFLVPPKSSFSEIMTTADGRELGNVEVVYSGERINGFMKNLLTVPPAAQAMVFLAIICAIYFFFQKKVGAPIRNLQDSIRRVTDGDLSVGIPDMENNELGDIADGLKFLVQRLSSTAQMLNVTAEAVSGATEYLRETFRNTVGLIKKQSDSMEKMARSLKNAIESQQKIIRSTEELTGLSEENLSSLLEVKASADEIVAGMENLFQAAENSYSIVAQMSQTSKAMNSGAREALSSVENTSTSIEEILASVKEVEKNAKESSSLAEQVRTEAAQRGVNTVAEAVKQMEAITAKVRFSVDIVKRLEAHSTDIQRIISVINEVTEKTNLLSLNAAILAEQAGEYGKGFSVVSEEMRALSGRTASHAKEIDGIVNTIQSEIGEVVDSIMDGMDMVRQGSDTVYRVGETMSSILEISHRSATMTKTIEKATEDQVQALRHIESSVVDINRMAQNMSKAAEEQNRASGYMLERVGEVREIAEATKKGTSEQAEGANAISENLELANEKISGINMSVLGQQSENHKIISAVGELKEAGLQTLRDVEGVSGSLNRLLEDIYLLKKEMETFRRK